MSVKNRILIYEPFLGNSNKLERRTTMTYMYVFTGQLAAGYQVSFGLVLIYMHDTWGVIAQNKTQPFTRNAADSVCRQMGYTEANPNHITTAKNSNTSYPQ